MGSMRGLLWLGLGALLTLGVGVPALIGFEGLLGSAGGEGQPTPAATAPASAADQANSQNTQGQGSDQQEPPAEGGATPLAYPSKVVIQIEKGWRGDGRDDVSTAPLTVWDASGLSWSPLSSARGSASLSVDDSANGSGGGGGATDDAQTVCDGSRKIDEASKPKCYVVEVDKGDTLSVGTSTATIYVEGAAADAAGAEDTPAGEEDAAPAGEGDAAADADAAPAGEGDAAPAGEEDAAANRTAVAVEVLVGRPLWVLILAVGLGVLATEAWLGWRERASYRLAWWDLRGRWLDWLSEDLGWTRPYKPTPQEGDAEPCSGKDDAERPPLRQIRQALSDEVGGLRDGWSAAARAK